MKCRTHNTTPKETGWGCPECTRELRAENERLKHERNKAAMNERKALEWYADAKNWIDCGLRDGWGNLVKDLSGRPLMIPSDNGERARNALEAKP